VLVLVLFGLIVPIPISLIIEAMRKRSSPPESLDWDPQLDIRYTEIDGMQIRYVDSINPYDYGGGGGMHRANFIARLIGAAALVPVLGETVMRLRLPFVEAKIMEGGVGKPPRYRRHFFQNCGLLGRASTITVPP